MKKTPFKRKITKPLKRTRLRVVGKSDTATLKKEIQAVLREIVIKRDGGCILRDYPETGKCGGYRNDGKLILQAEHLNSRSHTSTFADPRNVVCLCQRHHIYWKPQNSKRYWEIVEEQIGATRWEWLQRAMQDRRAYKVDLKLELLALKQELKKLKDK